MRYAVAADRFYPWDEDEARAAIEYCFDNGPGRPSGRGNGGPKAVIVPHAGYIYSGICAAYAFKALAERRRPEAYIVIGPDHYGNGYDVCLCSEPYETPFGECEVDWELAAMLARDIPDSPSAHSREHSVEVELPFLKYIDPDAKIVPVIMGDQRKAAAVRLADSIKDACEGRDVVIIASSDLVHYVPRDYATDMDERFMACVKDLDVDGIYDAVRQHRLSVCGYGPIAAAMMACSAERADILKITDSGEVSGGTDRVVGYASAALYRP